jgi:hypothetical protein
VIGELQKSLTNAQHIQKLLGVVGGAHGPEPAPNSTRHYDAIVVFHTVSSSLQHVGAAAQESLQRNGFVSDLEPIELRL